MLPGRQDSWLLLPAVGSPSYHIAGVIMFDLLAILLAEWSGIVISKPNRRSATGPLVHPERKPVRC